MKNYFKISMLSMLIAMTSFVFTSCETESLDESSIEANVKTEVSEKLAKLSYNASGINITEVSRKEVAIKGQSSNLFLSSENGNGSVTMNRTRIGSWETFTMVTFDDGSVCFIGNNGKFMQVRTSGAYPPLFTSAALQPYAIFDIAYESAFDGYTITPSYANARFMVDNTNCTATNVQLGVFCFGDLAFTASSAYEKSVFSVINQ